MIATNPYPAQDSGGVRWRDLWATHWRCASGLCGLRDWARDKEEENDSEKELL
jgi:hypothetical protein